MAIKERDIPQRVKTIPDLIEWLANEDHNGVVSEISRKVGASIATANFWKRGVVLPNLEYLRGLAFHYDLPWDRVMECWEQSRRERARQGRRGFGLIIAFVLLSPSLSVAGVIHSPCVVQVVERMSLLRHWLHRLARPLLPPCLA